MKSEPIHILTLKSNQQRPEFINPGKGPFNDEAFLVYLTIEMPLPPTFDCFPVAFVLWNVGTHASIPQHLPCFSCVKTAIRIEKGRPIFQTVALQISKDLGDGCPQLIAVIMAPPMISLVPTMLPFPSITGMMLLVFAFFLPWYSTLSPPF